MTIRKYRPEDCEILARLFYETVHSVNARDYTAEQLDAWADGNVDLEKWNETLSEHFSLVAEEGGKLVGFGDIDKTGYLDRLYVHKDCQRRGIASAICDSLEPHFEVAEITTHASITARPFFERRGYTVIRQQEVERAGVVMTNFVMKKVIESAVKN